MEIRFVRTRHIYDSYRDFWSLVELSGYKTCFVDEIDVSQPLIYIVTPINGEIEHVRNETNSNKTKRSFLIWWCLERWDSNGEQPLDTRMHQALDEIGFDAAWVADRYFASLHPRLRHAVLGGHVGLKRIPNKATVYDVAHISYPWGRREALYLQLARSGLSVAPKAFGSEREEILATSRLILSLHQYPGPIIAPLRFALAAAYEVPLVSEEPADPFPHERGFDLLTAPYDKIVQLVHHVLHPDQEAERKRLAANLKQRLCHEWTFDRGVRDAISKLGLEST